MIEFSIVEGTIFKQLIKYKLEAYKDLINRLDTLLEECEMINELIIENNKYFIIKNDAENLYNRALNQKQETEQIYAYYTGLVNEIIIPKLID